MQNSISKRKLIGILGIILGLLCFGSFFAIYRSKLIIPISSLILVKYLIVIGIINFGFSLIIFGVLNYIEVLIPYHTEGITKYEKAKNILFSIVLLVPFWLSFFTTIFVISKTMLWKILGSLALIYIAWLLYSSVKVLKKEHKEQSQQ